MAKSSEYDIQQALRAWKRGDFQIKRKCAKAFNVNYETFRARLRGRASKATVPKSNGRLTREEENALLRFMLSLDESGIQGTLKTVRSTAMDILRRRPGQVGEPEPISAVWPRRFMKRHANQITLQRDVVQELDRVAAEDPVEIVGVILVGQIGQLGRNLAILHRTAGAGQDVGLYSEDPHLTAAVMTDDPIGRRVHEEGWGALLSGRSNTTGRRDCRQSRLEPRTR